eukprot:312152_1
MSSNSKVLNVDDFVYTTVMVRENTSWHRWAKALYKKHKHERQNASEKNSNINMKQKLAKSTHKWKLKKDATFGKIRIRLGKYYNINPYNIEIWIRSKLGKNKTKQWVYDLQDRGLSEDSIEDRRLLTDAFQRQYMFVKFEIVAYDIRNFDKMISNSKMSPQPKNNVISELAALFDFDFYTPNDNMFDT